MYNYFSMATYKISLNPVNLSELTNSEAVEICLYTMSKFVIYLRNTLYTSADSEFCIMTKVTVLMQWYFRSMVRIISADSEDFEPEFKIECIKIKTLNRMTGSLEKVSFTLTEQDLSLFTHDKMWEITTMLLKGCCSFLQEQAGNRHRVSGETLQTTVATELNNMNRILLFKLPTSNEMETNFYKLKVKVMSGPLRQILQGLE